MGRYRFLLRPRWLALHLLALVAVVVFVNLGLWQVHRLQEKRDYNATVSSRQDQPSVPLGDLVAPGSAVGEAEFRPVTVTGRYLTDDQVVVRYRTQNSAPGYWVLTPLLTADGSAVVVNRGWVPYDAGFEAGPVAQSTFAPPAGEVTVTGMVRATQARESGPVDPADGRLTNLARADIDRIARQVPYRLYPVRVDLRTQAPAQSGQLPVPVPPPELDEGPHLNYAGQWFIFATLTIIVYPLFIRRAVRNRERSGDDDTLAAGDPSGGEDGERVGAAVSG